MSTLVLDELFDGVTFEQEFKIERDINIAHIRPWIYVQGTIADGDLQLEVLEASTVLAVDTITAAEINAGKTESFAHGFIRFDFDVLCLRVPEGLTEGTYKIRLQMVNHTTDPSNFVGAVRNWDLKIYDTYGVSVTGNQALNDMVEPLGLEIYEYRRS